MCCRDQKKQGLELSWRQRWGRRYTGRHVSGAGRLQGCSGSNRLFEAPLCYLHGDTNEIEYVETFKAAFYLPEHYGAAGSAQLGPGLGAFWSWCCQEGSGIKEG